MDSDSVDAKEAKELDSDPASETLETPEDTAKSKQKSSKTASVYKSPDVQTLATHILGLTGTSSENVRGVCDLEEQTIDEAVAQEEQEPELRRKTTLGESTNSEAAPTNLAPGRRIPPRTVPGAMAVENSNTQDRPMEWDNLMSVAGATTDQIPIEEDMATSDLVTPITAMCRDDMVLQETQNQVLDEAIVVVAPKTDGGRGHRQHFARIVVLCGIIIASVAVALPLILRSLDQGTTSIASNTCLPRDPFLSSVTSDPLWNLLLNSTSAIDYYNCSQIDHPLTDTASAQYRAYFDMKSWYLESQRSEAEVFERYAFTTFCFATGCNEVWLESENWLSKQVPVCDWYSNFVPNHVSSFQLQSDFSTCNENGRVIMLATTGANPVGTIPPELGLLTDLEILSLASDDLSGTLPPSLGRLTNLEHFSSSSSLITGTLPASYGTWTELRDFQLRIAQIEGQWPTTYKNWKKVISIRVDTIEFEGTLPEVFCNMTFDRIVETGGWSWFPSIESFKMFGQCETSCSCCTTCCTLNNPADCRPNTAHPFFDPSLQP